MATIPLANLGNKAAGELIRSNDWNSLVAAVATIQTGLANLTTTVNTKFAQLDTTISSLTNQLAAANTNIEKLSGILHKFYRIKFDPPQSVYLLGDVATLTVHLTDVEGRPLSLTDQTRPRVVFVTTRGVLRAVPGSEASEGFSDNSLIVRTNAAGVAQVRLQPQHAGKFPLETENDVSGTFNGQLASNERVGDIIRNSNTPLTAKTKGAFKQMTTEYERADTESVRKYVDGYYQLHPQVVAGVDFLPQRWNDQRYTVLCFVETFDDHSSLGTGAIDVLFRDWISPWFNTEYVVETDGLRTNFRDRLAGKFSAKFDESVTNLKSEVNTIVADPGLLRKQRNYKVLNDALDQINLPQGPAFFNSVRQSVQDAIIVQQTLTTAQLQSAGAPKREVAFEAFTNASTKADANVAGIAQSVSAVQQQVNLVQQNVNQFNDQITNLRGTVVAHGARLDTAFADGGQVHQLRTDLNNVQSQVTKFQALNPADVQTKLALINSLDTRISKLGG